jgi:hypothetical protein
VNLKKLKNSSHFKSCLAVAGYGKFPLHVTMQSQKSPQNLQREVTVDGSENI